VLNVLPIGSLLMGPYRAALSGVGAAAVLAWLFTSALSRGETESAEITQAKAKRPTLGIAPAVGAVYLGVSLGLVLWGSGRWTSDHLITTTIARFTPFNLAVTRSVATELVDHDKTDQGMAILEKTLSQIFGADRWSTPDGVRAYYHDHPDVYDRIRESQGNQMGPKQLVASLYAEIAFGYVRKNEVQHAVEIAATGYSISRDSVNVMIVLAQCAAKQHHYQQAEKLLHRAQMLDPKLSSPFQLLATVYALEGRWIDARTSYQRYVSMEPMIEAGYLRLEYIQIKTGDIVGARRTAESADRIFGSDAARQMLRTIPQ